VALVRSDISEERIVSIIGVKIISELGTMPQSIVTANVVPNLVILFTLMMEAIHSS
jgi:hypothetical protein